MEIYTKEVVNQFQGDRITTSETQVTPVPSGEFVEVVHAVLESRPQSRWVDFLLISEVTVAYERWTLSKTFVASRLEPEEISQNVESAVAKLHQKIGQFIQSQTTDSPKPVQVGKMTLYRIVMP